MTLDRGLIEEGGSVVDGADDLTICLPQIEFNVELDDLMFDRNGCGGHAGKLPVADLVVVRRT